VEWYEAEEGRQVERKERQRERRGKTGGDGRRGEETVREKGRGFYCRGA
jgi:hypothetical protein